MQDTERDDPRFEALDGWQPATILTALWEGQLAAIAALGPALPAPT
jgi:N-acetylmuramic acid 6-phosphate etherase